MRTELNVSYIILWYSCPYTEWQN